MVIKNYDEELKAELALRHSRPSSPGLCVRWLPPQGGSCVSVKLNVDGAIDLKYGHRGVGFIVRDSSAALVGGVAMKAPGMVYVLATELYAIKMGISFALGCLSGGLVDEIRTLLASRPLAAVHYVQANKTAHQIAQFSLRDRGSFFLDGIVPP
ncbi:unnamed protein product [Prunus armeniaca]